MMSDWYGNRGCCRHEECGAKSVCCDAAVAIVGGR